MNTSDRSMLLNYVSCHAPSHQFSDVDRPQDIGQLYWPIGPQIRMQPLLVYDAAGYNQMISNARPNGVNKKGPPKLRMYGITYLRLSDELLQKSNFDLFKKFVLKMHADQDYCEDPQKNNHVIIPLKPSGPKFPIENIREATKPIPPFSWDSETDMNVDG